MYVCWAHYCPLFVQFGFIVAEFGVLGPGSWGRIAGCLDRSAKITIW